MDNISLLLMEQAKDIWQEEHISIQDLKAYCRAEKYLETILNTLDFEPNTILNYSQFEPIYKMGAVNRTTAAA